MRTRTLVLCALVAAPPLAAQEQVVTCKTTESFQACQARFTPTGSAPIPAPLTSAGAVTDAASRLQEKAAGPDLSSAGPLSSINDFLPRLATALLAPVTGGGAPELGFKLNLPLNDPVQMQLPFTGQITGVFHEPKLYGPLVDSIPSGIREASRARLEAGLNLYDNLALTGALNLENERYGRSPRSHRHDLDALARALLPTPAGGDPIINAGQELSDYTDTLDARLARGDSAFLVRPVAAACKPGPGGNGVIDLRMDCFTPAMQDSIEARISARVNAVGRYITAASRTIRESGFTRIAQLLNNQPQLNVSFQATPRRSLVGPTEFNGTARFEMGFTNWNTFRRYCRTERNEGITAGCLRAFTRDERAKASLARGHRVFLEATIYRRNAWEVSLPADSVSLSLPSSTTLAFSGGYGAYIGNAAEGENRDRLDLQTKYDWARDDAVRQNRWVSTLFYTRHVSGQATALIGFTWANRPEFVGDVTRHLGANIGFTYKLNQDPQSAAGQK